MLPIIAIIHMWHIWLSPINQYKWKFPFFFFDEKCGKKIREILSGIKLSYVICSLFHRKERDELMYFFFVLPFTDGARTRNYLTLVDRELV